MDAVTGLALLDDLTLVLRAQGGDTSAFSCLCDRHYRFVFQSSWRRVGNRTDAEDVAQESLIRMGQGLKSLRDPSLFRGWLMRIVVNSVADLYRKRSRDRNGISAFTAQGDVVWFDENTNDRDNSLHAAVRRLPHKQREAITHVYIEELSHREAAQAMGCAEVTVSWHVHAAKKRLKILLNEAAQ